MAKSLLCAFSLAFLLLGSNSRASALIIQNPNFDSGSAGWSISSSSDSSAWTFPAGAARFFTGRTSEIGRLSQTLDYQLEASTTYTLTFTVFKADSLSIGVPAAGADLFAGSTRINWDSIPDLIVSTTGTLWTFSLTTPSASPLIGQTVRLELNASTSGFFSGGIVSQQINFDNVALEAVPEPSTLALLALSAVGWGSHLMLRGNRVAAFRSRK
jgi:hypothetical protein